MKPLGTSCIVLHGHLPWVHHPTYEEFLEEDWFLEAVLDTYLPLLLGLDRLAADGVPVRLAVGLTPPLLEMLRARALRSKTERFLERRRQLAESEVRRVRTDPVLHTTARHYAARFLQLRDLWHDLGGDVVAGFRRHLEEGRLEILASAATHPILPLLLTDEARRLQVRIGMGLFREVFGREPDGFWLPECAYTPGLDRVLAEEGVRWMVLETHGVLAARPAPATGVHRPLRTPAGVTAFGRDPGSSREVWSSEVGYPGDPVYREFYRDLGFDGPYDHVRPWLHRDGLRRNLGIKYHRVTGSVGLEHKALYDPRDGRRRAVEHADDFLHRRGEHVKELHQHLGEAPVILSPYDLELFGHWWYEGPWFLEWLFRHMQDPDRRPPIELRTPREVLDAPGSLPEGQPGLSTWGQEGFLKVWLNERNAWVLRHQHECEQRMLEAVGRYPEAEGMRARLLDQMLRELLLLQSSDWAFIIFHETASYYATKRVTDHVSRFLELESALADPAAADEEQLVQIETDDAIFPGLDHRALTGGALTRGHRLGQAPAGAGSARGGTAAAGPPERGT